MAARVNGEKRPPRFKALAFDFNGVIVDDEMVHFDAFRLAIAPFGGLLTEKEYMDRYLALDDRHAIALLAADLGIPDRFDELLEAKIAHYMALVGENPPFYPGAIALIRGLSRRLPLAIVSGARRVEIEQALEKGGIAECFRFVVAAEDTVDSKPSPAPYRLAAERFSLSRHEIAAVEDSIGGVESAKTAGLFVVAVTHSYTRDRLSEADVVVDRLEELKGVILTV